VEIAGVRDKAESSVGLRDEWRRRNGRRLDEEKDKKKIDGQKNKRNKRVWSPFFCIMRSYSYKCFTKNISSFVAR
jgi:hypothetical protein